MQLHDMPGTCSAIQAEKGETFQITIDLGMDKYVVLAGMFSVVGAHTLVIKAEFIKEINIHNASAGSRKAKITDMVFHGQSFIAMAIKEEQEHARNDHDGRVSDEDEGAGGLPVTGEIDTLSDNGPVR